MKYLDGLCTNLIVVSVVLLLSQIILKCQTFPIYIHEGPEINLLLLHKQSWWRFSFCIFHLLLGSRGQSSGLCIIQSIVQPGTGAKLWLCGCAGV